MIRCDPLWAEIEPVVSRFPTPVTCGVKIHTDCVAKREEERNELERTQELVGNEWPSLISNNSGQTGRSCCLLKGWEHPEFLTEVVSIGLRPISWKKCWSKRSNLAKKVGITCRLWLRIYFVRNCGCTQKDSTCPQTSTRDRNPIPVLSRISKEISKPNQLVHWTLVPRASDHIVISKNK